MSLSIQKSLFGWDQPMKPDKSKRGQPKGNAACSRWEAKPNDNQTK